MADIANTRENYEPNFVLFNREAAKDPRSIATGWDGDPNHGTGSTSLTSFIAAYDRAIEMAELRGYKKAKLEMYHRLGDELISGS